MKRAFITIIGAIALAVGMWALLSTVEGDGINNDDGRFSHSIACGTALTGREEALQTFNGSTNCVAAVSDRQLWAWPLAAVGAIAVLGGVFAKRRTPRREQAS